MALKLGKCRLCLKLGDFYSIFTVDNSLQLAEMVMECARIKVYEGDGLPDKVCSECIQKLSSAYIFKQQCERSDQELRRNYVPPPGFSDTPPPPNRQSSDSAFSTHTDISNQTKPSTSTEGKQTPAKRGRKRSRESSTTTSVASRSNDTPRTSLPKKNRVEEIKRNEPKRPPSIANSYKDDSDFEDNSYSHYSAESDSDEPVLPPAETPPAVDDQNKCNSCPKTFTNPRNLKIHVAWHARQNKKQEEKTKQPLVVSTVSDAIPKTPINDCLDDDEKLSCQKCGKTFKLKIMLKRHHETCFKQSPEKSPQKSPVKELLVTLEPINPDKRYSCEMCPSKFKTTDNLEKHMRVCHAAVLKKKDIKPKVESTKVIIPCIYCGKPFDDYYAHNAHFNECPKNNNLRTTFECAICKKVLTQRNGYFLHLKYMHFEPKSYKTYGVSGKEEPSSKEKFECRMCSKLLPSQEQLITHLAAHVSNIDDGASNGSTAADNDARASPATDSDYGTPSGPLKCRFCDKAFTYKKSLQSHELKHSEGELKTEPPDPGPVVSSSFDDTRGDDDEDFMSDESSQDDGDNTCDICEKQFSYKKLLLQHKRTKHNMSSGHKRAAILLRDCLVKCQICDLDMKVSESNKHNQIHIAANIKPRNVYTCIDCGDTYKSCQALGNHIKLVHRLKRQVTKKFSVPDLADFCEVVVTKTEPLDTIQSHNGFGEVPADAGRQLDVNLSGFTCPICSKKMPTLVSLKRHVNWHTNVGNNIENKMECFVCKETFRFKGHYKLHMRVHYRDTNLDPRFLTCEVCGRRSKHLRAAQAHLNFHKQTRFQANNYKCSICKRVLKERKVYLSHMAIHYKRGESIANTVLDGEANFSGENVCPHCGKDCGSAVSLKHHITWHKSKTSLYGARHECHICHKQFTNKKTQELHLRAHYEDDNGPFKCNICGKGYTDEDYFRRHVKGHNFDHQSHKKRIAKLRENKVKCPICERYYPDLVKLIRHLRRTHPQSKMIKEDPDAPEPTVYPCKLCAKVFYDEKRLQSHEESHLRKHTFFKCKFCGMKNLSMKLHNLHVKKHLTTKHVDQPLKCEYCDLTFVWGYALSHHIRDDHKIVENWIEERTPQTFIGPLKELQCSICLKELASRGNYERHIDYHNTLRCNYCFDYFSTLRFLEGHLAYSCHKKKLIGEIENIPRKIKCEDCYKAFHLQVKLDCHLRIKHHIKVNREEEQGTSETVCDYCFRVFENEDALASHKIYHRTIGYYGCIYCDRKFNTITLYNKHKNHHMALLNVDNPTKCEHCDETFVAFREFIYHMRDEHNDDKEWIVLPKDDKEEKCPICNKIFFNLHRHLDYHEDNRCKKCGEYFSSRADFDNHLCAIDSDDEPQENQVDLRPKYEECTFCFKPMTRGNSRLKHDLIHKNSGAISCRFCKLKFKTMDAFNIHAFSHRSSKYKKKPLKCRKCGEKFIRYGPFMKHMKGVHKSKLKMHYRATCAPDTCVICGDAFPNLHNHYRAHMQNRCLKCGKYFTSSRVFSLHECDKEDSDPSKVFTSDVNLVYLITTYVPRDEKDDEKFFGRSDDEEEEEKHEEEDVTITEDTHEDTRQETKFSLEYDDDSQLSAESGPLMPISIQSPIISDVLSLYEEKAKENEVIDLIDDDSVGFEGVAVATVTIDD